MQSFLEKVRLRSARLEDISEIQRIDISAGALFDSTGLIDEGDQGQSPIPETALRAGISNDLLTLACTDEQIIGFVLCRKTSPDLYLEQVSVRPEFGRRGVGARLVQRAIEQADALRLRGVVLSTFRDVPWNGPFYAALGFSEILNDQMKPWMRDLETLQAHSMDVSLRCFMRRPGQWDRNWLRIPAGVKPQTEQTRIAETGIS